MAEERKIIGYQFTIPMSVYKNEEVMSTFDESAERALAQQFWKAKHYPVGETSRTVLFGRYESEVDDETGEEVAHLWGCVIEEADVALVLVERPGLPWPT